MAQQTFKERVAQVAIEQAKVYKAVYVDYEYLLCSEVFSGCEYYIIAATASNYRHLIGVNTEMTAEAFFEKCLTGTLTADDFDFVKRAQSEAEVKGSVRRKILALPEFTTMMGKQLLAEENFVKNKVRCSFATTDKKVTIGFTTAGKSRPMTLLRGDELDHEKCGMVELVLRRPAGSAYFNELVFGDEKSLQKYKSRLDSMLDVKLKTAESADLALV